MPQFSLPLLDPLTFSQSSPLFNLWRGKFSLMLIENDCFLSVSSEAAKVFSDFPDSIAILC